MALTAAGRFERPWIVIKKDNPLPGICGRVCDHPCEASCRRGELDEAVAICDVKRFLSDYVSNREGTPPARSRPPPQPPGATNRAATGRVAIVGSGPAGLTAAH